MINKEEIENSKWNIPELIDNEDIELSLRVERVTKHILDKVRLSGEMTYYDEDVMYILNYFLNRSMKRLTATEYVATQQSYLIHKEETRHLESHITALKEELQNQKEINKEHQKINGNLQKRITELEEICKGKSIQELGVSNLYKENE